MSPREKAELLEASRQEEALYRELCELYRAMAGRLRDERAPVDATWMAAQNGRATATVEALRALAAALAPQRLSDGAVPPEAAALWRVSAALATEAAGVNAELMRLARLRQADLSERVSRLDAGRRALAGYRPPGGMARTLAGRRA